MSREVGGENESGELCGTFWNASACFLVIRAPPRLPRVLLSPLTCWGCSEEENVPSTPQDPLACATGATNGSFSGLCEQSGQKLRLSPVFSHRRKSLEKDIHHCLFQIRSDREDVDVGLGRGAPGSPLNLSFSLNRTMTHRINAWQDAEVSPSKGRRWNEDNNRTSARRCSSEDFEPVSMD